MAKKKNFSAKFLNEIEKDLLKEKEALEKKLGKFTHKNPEVEGDYDANFPNYGDKDDENAAEVADYVVNVSMEETMEKALRDINKSLERLKKGNYGICKYCKNPIEEKRLQARPSSSACMECKKAIKQEI